MRAGACAWVLLGLDGVDRERGGDRGALELFAVDFVGGLLGGALGAEEGVDLVLAEFDVLYVAEFGKVFDEFGVRDFGGEVADGEAEEGGHWNYY